MSIDKLIQPRRERNMMTKRETQLRNKTVAETRAGILRIIERDRDECVRLAPLRANRELGFTTLHRALQLRDAEVVVRRISTAEILDLLYPSPAASGREKP